MTRPDTQTLYIMQNEFGLIKIGRSLEPERRRKNLQSGEACAIRVVAVLQGQGDREEQIHFGLKRHMIEGEWFRGTASARAAITKALPVLAGCDWPFEYDARGAEGWLDHFFSRRDQRSIEKQYARLLNGLRRIDKPGPGADAVVCHLLSLSEVGTTASVHHGRVRGQHVIYVYAPGSTRRRRAPLYSTDLASAMGLWPKDTVPAAWEGAAFDCAVAAMQERYIRLRGAA